MIHDCEATLRRKLEKTYLITGMASNVAATTLRAAPTPNRKLRREIPGGGVRVDPCSFVAMTSPLFTVSHCIADRVCVSSFWFQVPPKDGSVRSPVADSGFRCQSPLTRSNTTS